jgi:hypothetical protein
VRRLWDWENADAGSGEGDTRVDLLVKAVGLNVIILLQKEVSLSE